MVLSVFILFGAPIIAHELVGLARGARFSASDQVATEGIPPQPSVSENAALADPYAGAGLPQQ